MVDMTTISAGIAWGVPVRPDLLGQSLEAYEKFLPVLTTLRLCHRFGRGPDVHVTKLPVEILAVVEELIFDSLRARATSWISLFEHFESRCEPVDHDGVDDYIWDMADEEASEEKCEACRDPESDCDICSDCEKIVKRCANVCIAEHGEWRYDDCAHECQLWEKKIEQGADRGFAKYDKVCPIMRARRSTVLLTLMQLVIKHFGLEVYFATTRRPTLPEHSTWPSHPNHDWHYPGDELRTTTCYVILPRQGSNSLSYSLSEVEADCGFANVQAAQSLLVEMPRLQDKEETAKQFHRMLRILKLQPHVHESQLNSRVSANTKQTVGAESKDDSAASVPDVKTNNTGMSTNRNLDCCILNGE
jgi:hypothetical protein